MKISLKSILMIILAALVVITVGYTFPKKHTIIVSGIIFDERDPELEQATTIQVDGKIKRNLLGGKTFTGLIHIEGVDFPVPEEDRRLNLKFGRNNHAHILYTYIDNRMPRHYGGDIFINQSFSQVAISIIGKGGFSVSAPAQDREEAMELYDKLIQSSLEK